MGRHQLAVLGVLAFLGASNMAQAMCALRVADQSPIELFNGRDFTGWVHEDGSSPRWRIVDGYMEIVPGTGTIQTVQEFLDFELHLEFWIPHLPHRTGQDKGNSGVYLLGKYEIQILDSIDNPTYFAGQCASLYRLLQPTVNASRPAEQWQTFDLSFVSPRVNETGTVIAPGHLTVVHNNIPVIQDGVFVTPTGAAGRSPQGISGPIQLQDHNSPVRFRNLRIVPTTRH